MLKSPASVEAWRPVTLGIGSSLLISQRTKQSASGGSGAGSNRVNTSVPRSTGSPYVKSATSPRHKSTNVEEKKRSHSVMTARAGHWTLPAGHSPYSPLVSIWEEVVMVVGAGGGRCLVGGREIEVQAVTAVVVAVVAVEGVKTVITI